MDGKPALLTISIEPKESGSGYCIAATYGETERDIETDPLPTTLRHDLTRLRDAILNSPGARGTMPVVTAVHKPGSDTTRAVPGFSFRADEQIVHEIGSTLFDFVFQRRILDLYKEAYTSAKNSESRLFIKLSVDPTLAYVPWEALWDKQNRFYLSADQYTPFSRGPVVEAGPFAKTGRPIRILGMAARVKTLNGIAVNAIDADTEQGKIKKALETLSSDKVKISWIPSAKARDLNRGLARGDEGKAWDIFHFIGHGGYDNESKTGFIVVQEEGGSKGSPLSSESLRGFLVQPRRTPKLVVLNSCSGAQAQPGDLFSSTAADLIQGGIAAVIAMQFEISDAMGIAFSDTFYTYLADGYSIQSALAHTRAELKARNFGEWISPVLYMRTHDGSIFPSAEEAGAAAPGPAQS
jgi:hypothetical protein